MCLTRAGRPCPLGRSAKLHRRCALAARVKAPAKRQPEKAFLPQRVIRLAFVEPLSALLEIALDTKSRLELIYKIYPRVSGAWHLVVCPIEQLFEYDIRKNARTQIHAVLQFHFDVHPLPDDWRVTG